MASLAPLWLLLPLSSACSSALVQGDRAFADAHYADAARAYEHVSAQDRDAALFRLAVLYEIQGTRLTDQKRAGKLLEELAARYPAGPYSVAAQQKRACELEANLLGEKLDSVTAEIKQARKEPAHSSPVEQGPKAVQPLGHPTQDLDAQNSVARLERELDDLRLQLKQFKNEHAELVALRREHAILQQLRKQNAHLREELDEMKRIDLRH